MKNIRSLFIKWLLFSLLFFLTQNNQALAGETWWDFQAIDTMKYSRDLSREKREDQAFLLVINEQVKAIAATGATHIAIATPYDEEFLPLLTAWVQSARRYHLHVWFRGNWSGWEQWFEYPAISEEEHIEKTKLFIRDHPDLFVNGDVFSACPECENGGPGDPRETKNVQAYRNFLIHEHREVAAAFAGIEKREIRQFHSMNADVARLVMDQKTTTALGGLVVIDHYVAKPEQLAQDIQSIARESGGTIILGEFGAPIPDIHGDLTKDEQSAWLNRAFTELVSLPQLRGISYWVNVGGSTQLWEYEGANLLMRPAAGVVTHFYLPPVISAVVQNEWGSPLSQVEVTSFYKKKTTDASGTFELPVPVSMTLFVHKTGYADQEISLTPAAATLTIILQKQQPDALYRLLTFLHHGLKILRLV